MKTIRSVSYWGLIGALLWATQWMFNERDNRVFQIECIGASGQVINGQCVTPGGILKRVE